jgi:hypothetical protein
MGLTCTLTGTIYRDDGAVATGAVVSFTLCAPRNTHWTSNNRVVLRAVLSATTDGSGNFSQVVARNDELTPAGTYWKVECADAALLKHIAANADTLNVIDAPDLDASAQVFSGLDDPDADWVAHGHAQTLTAAKKLQAATNLGLNLSASQLLGQASSGGTGLPVAVTLGTGLAMSGTTLNATSSVSDGDKGDITVSNTGATWTIDNDAITLAKLAHMPTARVVGRTTAGTGTPELLTISGTGSVAMTTSPTFTTPALGTPASGDFSTGAFAWPTFDQNTTGSAGSAATLTTTRTIGGADFNGSADVTSFPSPGAIGGTTPNTIAGTTGTFSGDLITTGTNAQIYTSGAAAYLATYGAAAHIYTDGANAQIYTSGTNATISTGGSNAHISTGSSGAYIQTRSTFRLNGGAFVTTLSHAATADRAIAFPDAPGTLALVSGDLGTPSAIVLTNASGTASININGTVGATTPSTIAGTTITGTSSLTLGTNGGTGGSVVLNGATSGSSTLSVSATGVLALPSFTAGSITVGSGVVSAAFLAAQNPATATLGIDINPYNSATQVTAGHPWMRLGGGLSEYLMINAGLTSGYVDICADLGSGLKIRDGTGGHETFLTTPATGTLRVTTDGSTLGTVEAATGTFTTLTASATTSLLLGTAGSAVGTIGFRNATSGTTTLAPATGALGTGTVTLPLSGTLATLEGTETLTNKRITQRSGTATSSVTPTINTDNVDFYSLTAQAADITSFTTNLSGTPTEGQTLWIAITGTAARAITWGATFEAGAVALPTTTVSTDRLDVAFVWNTVTSKWRCMASG